jgi:hypothetical protein
MAISRVRAYVLRCVLAASVLAVLSPLVAYADSIVTIDNVGGKSGTPGVGINGPFSLTKSAVTSIDGAPVVGSLSFTTGAFVSGNLWGTAIDTVAATWNSGGTFTITEQGMGTIFTGSFSGPVTWEFTGCSVTKGVNQCSYTLTGAITGTYEGQTVTGATTQFNFTLSGASHCPGCGNYMGGSIKNTGGVTSFPVNTPEPASLGLMGTGLMLLGFLVRRKVKTGSRD